jgi:signal transduction histidine kinase
MSPRSSRWSALFDWVRRLSPPVATGLVVLLSAVIGFVDGITGWEVSLFVFYAIPIVTSVWSMGLRAGLITAVFNSVIWLLANLNENPYETSWGYPWAMLNRLVYFSFVAIGTEAIKRKMMTDAEQLTMLNDIRQLEKEIVHAREQEQQRIGRDLHDGLCQQLAAIGCALRALAEDLQIAGSPGAEDALRVEEAIRRSALEARSIALGINPVHMDSYGLSAALADLATATRTLTNAHVHIDGENIAEVDDPELALNLYRIAQEAVSNAVKHSAASDIRINLLEADGHYTLIIEDNGSGIDLEELNAKSMGLRTMTYRAESLGGRFSVSRKSSGGTVVACTVPVVRSTPPQ